MKKLILAYMICMAAYSGMAQNGRVGINTTNPSAMLHVKDSGVLFTGATSLPITAGNPPVIGSGTRMMWYPNKAAWRSGGVSAGNWDKDSIGQYSIAAGFDTKAKGSFAVAFGYFSFATGDNSTAFGVGAKAIGTTSTVMGEGTRATGTTSFAIGDYTHALGDYSTAMGSNTLASGIYSTALGYSTTAEGYASTAMTDNSIASGDYSVAMGSFTHATADYATAMGKNTYASGYASTAMGENSVASGYISTAMGGYSTAEGDYSLVTGYNTWAKPYASVAIGQFNEISGLSDSWVPTDPVFIIGNGVDQNNRSNAFTVLKNGNTTIAGNLKLTTGEINRASGNANLIPICYGSVTSPSTINSGTGNFTVIRISTGIYEITITGETYSNTGYVTTVTPVNTAAIIVGTDVLTGKLRVKTFNAAGTAADSNFHFSIFKE